MRLVLLPLVVVSLGVGIYLAVASDARSGAVAQHVCAQNDGHFSNYGTAYIGPNNTYWAQYTGDQPYNARRKDPATGQLTYSYDVNPPTGFSAVFDVDNNRYSGEKNLNGQYAYWWIQHWTKTSC